MPQLKIRLFGAPQFELAGDALDLEHRKPAALLAYLCVSGKPYTRDALATLFWPESGKARTYLRNALSIVRRSLGDDFAEWLLIERTLVGLQPGCDLWLDVVEFQRSVDEFRVHRHVQGGLCATCVDHLTVAATLYQDDFLAGFSLRDSPAFAEWSFYQREQLRSDLAVALTALAEYYGDKREFDSAIRHARRLLALDPLYEPAHRQLMYLNAQNGHHALAIHQYEECARILDEELGVQPEEQTKALIERIKRSRSRGNVRGLPVAGEDLAASADHSPPNNLSTPLTPLIGRDDERRTIHAILQRPEVRLLTLSGPGGVGKTRLSQQIAIELLEQRAGHVPNRYGDGIYFVSLAPVRDIQLIASAIAETLTVREVQHRSVLESLTMALRSKRMLLVLDNFEHLLSTAPLVAELLRACPHLEVIVTSRELLRLSGEHEYVVPPLALPPLALSMADETGGLSIADYSAVELFRQRAVAARHDFVLDKESGPAVGELCVRLDGLPLAIELAAARVKHFSIQALLTRLGDATVTNGNRPGNLQFLKSDARDIPERHRSLWSALDWSYHLLDGKEQALFRRLAIFVGGWSADAARTVCIQGLFLDIEDGLASLVDKSLVKRVDHHDDEPRFMMLETLREFGLENLRHQGELGMMQQQFALYCTEFVEHYNEEMFDLNATRAIARLRLDHANIRAATKWVLAERKVDIALRLCAALLPFWNAFPKEARQVTLATLTMAEGSEPSVNYVQTLICAGLFSSVVGQTEARRNFMTQSLEMNAAIGNQGHQRLMGIARGLLAWSALDQGNYDETRKLFSEDVAYSRRWGDDWTLAMSLVNAGRAAFKLGEFERAERLIIEALSLHRRVGQAWGLAKTLIEWSLLCIKCGRLEEAYEALSEGLQLAEDSQLADRIPDVKYALGILWLKQNDVQQAEVYLKDSLRLHYEFGRRNPLIETIETIAQLAIRQGNAETCLQLIAATEAARVELRLVAPPVDRAAIDEAVAKARHSLPEYVTATAWAEGEAMSLDAAVEHALTR